MFNIFKEAKVEVIETTITLDSSIRESLSDESNNWAVIHTTDLKEELKGISLYYYYKCFFLYLMIFKTLESSYLYKILMIFCTFL